MEAGHAQSIARAFLAPWAITAEGHVFVQQRAIMALQAQPGAALEGTRRASVRSGVAVVPVMGPLSKSPSWWLGGCDYETILHDLNEALDSSEVKSVIFDIDSPGGVSSACGELSTAIFAARARGKRIVAYVSGQMCSAAYWIGSAAHEVVCDASGIVGSVGVRTVLVDESKFLEKLGLAVYDCVSDQSPYKVVDASKQGDRDRVIATMTALADVFIGDVARNRGVTSARVKSGFGKGDVFVGKAAVAAGMVDRLGDFESLLAELSPTTGSARRSAVAHRHKGKNMTMKAAKCDGCDRGMDDGDDLYCTACHSSADAKALLSLTGGKTLAEAMATVSGWKIAAGEVGAMRAQLAAQQAAADAQAFDAAIVEAKAKQLLAPSDAHKRNVAALAFKGKPDGVANLKSFLAAFDPLVGSADVSTPAALREPPPSAGAIALTAEERRIAARMGVTIEAATKNKARLLAAVPNDTDVDSDDEDAA